MARSTQTQKLAAARNVVAGLRKRFPSRRQIWIGGKPYTPDEVMAFFQRHIDALEAIHKARAQLTAAVAHERAIALAASEMALGLKSTLTTEFGPSATLLADFGWSVPKKPGPKTVAAKVAGARKGKATREARHTMGKRQKAKIRGDVAE